MITFRRLIPQSSVDNADNAGVCEIADQSPDTLLELDSNWTSFYGVSDIGPDFSEDQCGSTIWPDVEKFWWHSPMKYADKVKTPTLFLHSLEDYRCPVDQGYQMYSALIAHGVESRLVLFRGENHELSRSGKPKHRIRRLNEITGWFEQHKG